MIAKLSRKDIKMLESSVKNVVSKSALEEYLSAHKKAETAWKVFRDSLVLSEGSSEDSASKKVKDEKVRKFKVGDKVRVLTAGHPLAYTENLNVGSVTTVAGYKGEEIPWNSDTKSLRPVLVGSHSCNSWGHFEESALRLVTEEEKTPNELRAEIIEKAKEFAEEYADYPLLDSVIQISEQRSKRKIVASVISIKNMQFTMKEITVKTHPDDVYNFHIGKAIAIGRLLGKDVSEFENAVQPTLTKGQIAKFTPRYEGRELEIQIKKVDGEKLWFANKYGVEMYLGSGVSNSNIKIASDTHAQYKVLNNE